MSVQLGTIAPIGFEDFASPRWLACMRRLGCKVVQAYRNRQADVTIEQMKQYIRAGQMDCDSLHGIYGDDVDPSSPDERIRSRGVEAFKDEGRLVRDLGGHTVIIHPAGIVQGQSPDPQSSRRRDQLVKSIEQLGRFGQEIGVQYAFENLPAYHPICHRMEDLTEMLSRAGAPHTGICFDTGHAHMTEGISASLAGLRSPLLYVHFCDNHGSADEHLMPGQGTIDLDALALELAACEYDGTIMLEVFHDLRALEALVDQGYGRVLADFLAKINGL